MFRYFSQVTAVPNKKKAAKTSWIEASIILCALFIKDRSIYKRIGAGAIPVSELCEYFKALDYSHPPQNHSERYIIHTVLACHMRDNEKLLNEIADAILEYEGKISKGTEGIENIKKEK